MERYIGTKIILAEPMDELGAQRAGLLKSGVVTTIESDGSSRPGYRVVYEDGYVSWSPKETFDRAYRRMTDAELAMILTSTPATAR